MRIEYTEEQRLIRETTREFAAREIRPHARGWDAAGTFPLALVPRLAAQAMGAERHQGLRDAGERRGGVRGHGPDGSGGGGRGNLRLYRGTRDARAARRETRG